MSRVTGTASPIAFLAERLASGSPPPAPRLAALGFGLGLLGAVTGVFVHVADVAGGLLPLVIAIGGTLVLATLLGRRGTTRAGLRIGLGLFVMGVLGYLLLVPELHDELFTVEFMARWLDYLGGSSVLGFEDAGLWAVLVAPGPVYITWFLALRREYGLAALAGGGMLGFFALTGDADPTTTLVGMLGVLGLVGAGAVERSAGTWREVARVGFLLSIAAIVARRVQLVPGGVGWSPAADGGEGGDGFSTPIQGDLEAADDRARIHESISLSPKAYFTVEADRPVYRHVAAYDRYTGGDWIRTGGTAPYDGIREPPPGEPDRVDQRLTVERSAGTLPAAWKAMSVDGIDVDALEETSLGGLEPVEYLAPGREFSVESAVPAGDPTTLRTAGTDYPSGIAERYTQLPERTADRVVELAEAIAGPAESPYDAAAAIRRWLQAEKGYSLTVDRPPGDVVDGFLFSMQEGYCVYFASAMAVLLRAVDVPCRFALGYTPGQELETDRWLVRGFDSHAWVEVYFPGVGWRPFDPTPASPRGAVQRTLLSRAREANVSGIDTNASLSIGAVSFAQEVAQAQLGRNSTAGGTNASTDADAPATPPTNLNLTEGGASAAPEGIDPAAAVGSVLGDRDRLSLLAGAVGVGIGLHWIGVFRAVRRAIKLRWQRPTESPRRDVVRAYERLEILLARRGRDRAPGETSRQFVDAATTRFDPAAVGRVVDLYERARFGDGVTRDEADEAIGLVDGLVDGDRGIESRG